MPSIYLSGSVQKENVGADGVTEAERMQSLAHDVGSVLEKVGLVVYYNNPNWTINRIVEDSNAKSPDLHLSLHTNADNGQASGTETWCYGIVGTRSSEFGQLVQSALVQVLGLPDRGIKDATQPGYRWAEVYQTNATAVLTEVFFHDNLNDIGRYSELRPQVVNAIARTVLHWFGSNVPVQPDRVTVLVGGKVLEGIIIDDRTFAPVRELANSLGRQVSWDPVTKTVIIT